MKIIKSNFKYASPVASFKDVKLLNEKGLEFIKKLPNSEAILTRLVNSSLIPEGKY